MHNKPDQINPAYQREFLMEISQFNLQRGKIFASVIIAIELVLLVILLMNHNKHTSFQYNWYAFMYLLMIFVTAGVWGIISRLEKKIKNHNEHSMKTLEFALTSYIIFLMVWGALISLNDQVLYGSTMAFLVNVLIASLMFYLKPQYTLISLLTATAFFYIGLPFYQPSSDILIGHYVNNSIFIVFIWFLARANYLSFVRNFLDQKVIEEKSNLLAHYNDELLKEIESRKKTQKELEAANEKLLIISTLDALTGIPNRRRLDEVLQEQWDMAVENHSPICIMMIDIDYFKLYNDTHGHLAGDRCLQAVAELLNECRRSPSDFVARFGGEEFLFISTGMSREEIFALGERIRIEIETLHIEHLNSPVTPWITVSLGISHTLPGSGEKLAKSLELADQALYNAKARGRNKIVLAD